MRRLFCASGFGRNYATLSRRPGSVNFPGAGFVPPHLTRVATGTRSLIIWIDAQLSPALTSWIATNFSIECQAVRELGFLGAKDRQIFDAAREADAVA